MNMKNLQRLRRAAALAAGLLATVSGLARADWQDGQPALGVIGQANFNSGETNRDDSDPSNPTAQTLYFPHGVVADPETGKVFVADTSNNRVLRFGSAEAMGVGVAAEAVFGQPDFMSGSQGTTASSLWLPYRVEIDAEDNLWVADHANNRVLMFEDAVDRTFTDGNAILADGVLGQPNLTSRSPATAADGMNQPSGLTADSAGRLYVSELDNHRVLRFDNAAASAKNALVTGTAVVADGVLGQAGFLSGLANRGGSDPGANTLDSPIAVEIGNGGELWVADRGNRRVLRFDNPATQAGASGADANGVLGSSSFVVKFNIIGTDFRGVWDVVMDAVGSLWVVTEQNHRVVRFDNAVSKDDGAVADGVLGQKDLSVESTGATNWDSSGDSHGATPTNTGMEFPRGVASGPDGKFMGGRLSQQPGDSVLRSPGVRATRQLDWQKAGKTERGQYLQRLGRRPETAGGGETEKADEVLFHRPE